MKQRLVAVTVLLGCAWALGALAQTQDRFHHKTKTPKINYDSLYAAATPLSGSEEGRQIVDACMRAYGGEERLKALRGFELTYQSTSKFSMGISELVKAFGKGRRYRIERFGEARTLNGRECWFQNSDTLMALDSGRYRAELYSYLTLAMPLAIKTERFDGVRYGTRAQDPLAYVYMEKQDSLMVVLGIDKSDNVIRTVEGIVRQGESNFVFINRFDDHLVKDGFRFPARIVTVSLGLEVSRAQLQSVRVNPDFDKTYFRPTGPLKTASKGDQI